jgi:hypothetical protein
MSSGRLIPAEVDSGAPEPLLDEELGSLRHTNTGAPRAPRLSPEERGRCAKAVAEHIAHLERIPTAELSTEVLRRLTLVAIEVSGADPPAGEPH